MNAPAAMQTLLIIDDDEPLLQVFQRALQWAGYNVLLATNGRDGLDLAHRNLPDLILTDINMPGMEGTEVLAALRADPELGNRQIVLMTGSAAVTPRRGMQMGADDFLVKPFTVQELLACVEARLRRARVHWRVDDAIVSELRSSLRSTLPHEFFTPLAGMLGLVEVLRGDVAKLSPAEMTDVLDEIDRSGWRLHRTLKNYLFVLDLEAETKPLELTAPPLSAESVQAAINSGIEAAMKRQRRTSDLVTRLASVPVRVRGADLVAMVEELVDNACSFSRRGTPIQVTLDDTGQLTVTDHGRGLTPAQIEQIGAFHQFDRKKFEQQGLGLGLFIVRKLAERTGAEFQIESRPGEGTTANVELPAAAS